MYHNKHHGLRLMLMLMLASAMLVPMGCSWFRKTPKKAAPQVGVTQPPAPEPTPPPGVTPSEHRPGETIPFPPGTVERVYFDYDKSNIRRDQLDTLAKNLKYLKDNPNDKVLIEGHCDERGSVEYNFSLGQRRATSVKDYLVKNGIAADRISTVSKGKEEPLDPGHNEAAWAKNRRAEFLKMF